MKDILSQFTKQKPPSVADTNILIRLILKDEVGQVNELKKVIRELPPKSIYLPDIVVAETVFVLTSYYKYQKNEIVDALLKLFSFEIFFHDQELISSTFKVYIATNLHFTDAYLLALKSVGRISKIYTFDKEIINYSG